MAETTPDQPSRAAHDTMIIAGLTVIFALRAEGPGALEGREDDPARPTLWLPLVRRIRPPFEGQWALPGGPLRRDEDLEAAAARTLQATTQLAPSYLEQLYAFGTLDRAPASAPERVVSIVYWAMVDSEEATRATETENVHWFSVDDLPDLAFDHDVIIEYALWRLRNKVEYSRIAHAFLGDTFTLAQLREVHEAILGRTLDPANFRRQIEAGNTIVPTGKRVVDTSYRPPKLYRYNRAVEPVDRGPLGRAATRPPASAPTPSAPTPSAPTPSAPTPHSDTD